MKRNWLTVVLLVAGSCCFGCVAKPGVCPADLSDFETFTLQASGCIAEGEIMHAIIEKEATGSYIARFALIGEPWLPLPGSDGDCADFEDQAARDELAEHSIRLSDVQAMQLREIFNGVRCDTRNPLTACLLGQDQNQTCVYTIFGWDDQYAPDWTCRAGGQFTILLGDSQRIREFLQSVIE